MRNTSKPIVYISYSWITEDRNGSYIRVPDPRAFELAERLREAGFDSRIDIYFTESRYGFQPPESVDGDPRTPWTIWQEEQIRSADCVLLLCTPEYFGSYYVDWPGIDWLDWHELDDAKRLSIKAPGLWYDWHYMKSDLDSGNSPRAKFIPVGFDPYNPDYVPPFVRGATYCNLDSITEYEGLIRRIKNIQRQRNPRRGVFVSYAHKDENVWLESLLRHLEPLEEHQIEVWTDREIKPGARWHDEIQNSLWRAKVAVLMVSPDFLTSSYITSNELPPLLKAATSEGLILFWIPVKPSSYASTEINHYHAAHPPDQPLSNLNDGERDEAFVVIAKKLMDALGI